MLARHGAVSSPIVSLVLTLVGVAPAVAQIVDQGVVVVDPNNNLRIGIDAFGQREITNAIDGPYSGIALGEALGGDGHLSIGQSGSLSATDEVSLGLPTGGLGNLRITNGAFLSTTGAKVMSHWSDPGPQIVASGPGTIWMNSGPLYLGQPSDGSNNVSGTARMDLSNGAHVETAGLSMRSSGGPTISSLSISGPNTQFLNSGNTDFVGSSGVAQIDILDGAAYHGSGSLFMYSRGPKRIAVRGTNSLFQVGNSTIGGDFIGETWFSLEVSGGGKMITENAQLSTRQSNRVRITDPGSQWIINGALSFVPIDGGNSLEILNGASVRSTTSSVSSGSAAFVKVSGFGSEWETTGQLGLSSSFGQASVFAEAGGALKTGSAHMYGVATPDSGTAQCRINVTGAGTSWNATGDIIARGNTNSTVYLDATDGGTIRLGGTLLIQDAGFVSLRDAILEIGRDLILVEYEPMPTSGPGFIATNTSISLARHFSHDRKLTSEVGLGDILVQLRGGDTLPNLSFHGLEVGGLDAGNRCDLLTDDNFGIGQLSIGHPGAPTLVSLYNAMDNGHRNGPGGTGEALYLFGGGAGSRCARSTDGLVMEPGSILELNGIHTYVYDAAQGQFVHLNAFFPGSPNPNEISMFGGTIRLVPETGLLTGIVAGGLSLAAGARADSRRRTNHEESELH